MNELYVFVDSERPDQYLNSIMHCVLEREVRTIVFLHIKSLTSADADRHNPGLSGRVMAAVQSQLEGLAERREYLSHADSPALARKNLTEIYGTERALEIGAYYRRARELPLSWSNRELAYEELRPVLKGLAALGSSAFLDVTAVKKRYLGDIVAAGLVEGVRGLWTFDLLVSGVDFSMPWTILIHDLREAKTPAYRYTNLLDTDTYKACVRLIFVRAPRYRRLAIGTVALIVVGALGYFVLGEDHAAVKLVMALSGVASIAALALVFTPPRAET